MRSGRSHFIVVGGGRSVVGVAIPVASCGWVLPPLSRRSIDASTARTCSVHLLVHLSIPRQLRACIHPCACSKFVFFVLLPRPYVCLPRRTSTPYISPRRIFRFCLSPCSANVNTARGYIVCTVCPACPVGSVCKLSCLVSSHLRLSLHWHDIQLTPLLHQTFWSFSLGVPNGSWETELTPHVSCFLPRAHWTSRILPETTQIPANNHETTPG